MSLYLSPQYAFYAKHDDWKVADKQAVELTIYLKSKTFAGAERIVVKRIGVNDGDKALLIGLKIGCKGDGCVYSGEIFDDQDCLVRPFDRDDGYKVEDDTQLLRDALKAICEAFPSIAALEWPTDPKRFFSVTS